MQDKKDVNRRFFTRGHPLVLVSLTMTLITEDGVTFKFLRKG